MNACTLRLPRTSMLSSRKLTVGRLRWLLASGDERDAEIPVLRHQILVPQRQINRPCFTDTDRTILAVLSTAFTRARLPQIMLIVQPKTVIGWHRCLVARHWTYPPTTRRSRPPTLTEIRRLAIRLAEENPTWGYRRVHGELCRIGYRIAASTVWTILRTAGFDPTPQRTGPTWAQFVAPKPRHCRHRLRVCRNRDASPVPCVVLHRDRHASRASRWDHHQPARTLDHPSRPELLDEPRLSVPVRDPRRCWPVLPCVRRRGHHAERWVGTLRHELLDRTIVWNERQLRVLLVDYIDHYNQHRPQRSLDQAAPGTTNVGTIDTGQPILRRTRYGGALSR